jgi:hypothetical protein
MEFFLGKYMAIVERSRMRSKVEARMKREDKKR